MEGKVSLDSSLVIYKHTVLYNKYSTKSFLCHFTVSYNMENKINSSQNDELSNRLQALKTHLIFFNVSLIFRLVGKARFGA